MRGFAIRIIPSNVQSDPRSLEEIWDDEGRTIIVPEDECATHQQASTQVAELLGSNWQVFSGNKNLVLLRDQYGEPWHPSE